MADKISQTKTKRLSQSWRKHIRRLKQAARKAGTPYRQPDSSPVPKQSPTKA
jgi:hypothetical protein